MPCSDQNGQHYEQLKLYEKTKYLDAINELKKRNDKLARINCKLLNKLTEFVNVLSDPEIKNWFTEHQKFDTER